MRLQLVSTAGLIALLGIIGCPRQTAIWVLPGSTAGELQFGLGRKLHKERAVIWSMIVVVHCGPYNPSDTAAMWIIQADQDLREKDYPTRVKYGVLPSDSHEHFPARPLVNGCYRAETGGSGHVEFTVDSAGNVSSLDQP